MIILTKGGIYYSSMYDAYYIVLDHWYERNGCLEIVKIAELVKRTAATAGFEQRYTYGKGMVRCARTVSAPWLDEIEPGETRGGVANAKLCDHYHGWKKSKRHGWICPLCGMSWWQNRTKL